MTSPLFQYYNGSIILENSSNDPVLVNGRYQYLSTNLILAYGYFKAVNNLADPTSSSSSRARNISSGSQVNEYQHKGYLLGYVTIPNISTSFGINDMINIEQTYMSSMIPVDNTSSILTPSNLISKHVKYRYGDILMDGYITYLSGKYGGSGIDKILYQEIGGIPIVINGNMVTQ